MSLTKLTEDVRETLVTNAHHQLFEDDGINGLKYLRDRNINEETIKDWKLGYCPDFVRDLIFNDKIIIPYYDQYGKLLAVSARKITEEKPYWWNESFEKGEHLFGLHLAKKQIFEKNLAVIVEGQFDAISLHQSGIKIAVGLCGSAFTKKQLIVLSRYCNRIVIASDSDENKAGQITGQKIFDFLKNRNFHIYRWFFPNGYDPDLYVRRFGKDKCLDDLKKIIEKYSRKSSDFGNKYHYGED